ncbi:hypothetical protein C8J56DRAFT_1109896 [Mycena floridula]|nr:hypothetical protein C8J56DRAFT_1109896 [Mycena floridula]
MTDCEPFGMSSTVTISDTAVVDFFGSWIIEQTTNANEGFRNDDLHRDKQARGAEEREIRTIEPSRIPTVFEHRDERAAAPIVIAASSLARRRQLKIVAQNQILLPRGVPRAESRDLDHEGGSQHVTAKAVSDERKEGTKREYSASQKRYQPRWKKDAAIEQKCVLTSVTMNIFKRKEDIQDKRKSKFEVEYKSRSRGAHLNKQAVVPIFFTRQTKTSDILKEDLQIHAKGEQTRTRVSIYTNQQANGYQVAYTSLKKCQNESGPLKASNPIKRRTIEDSIAVGQKGKKRDRVYTAARQTPGQQQQTCDITQPRLREVRKFMKHHQMRMSDSEWN